MTGGSPTEVFEDFVLATPPVNLTSPYDLVNEATARGEYALSRFMRGAQANEMVQGGEVIKDETFLNEVSTFKNYKTNAKHNWENPQVLARWSVPWRFSMGHMQWSDQEVMLNNADLSDKARRKKYKDLKHSKEVNLWTTFMNGLEAQLFAAPDYDEMEDTTGGTPYSLPVFINEWTEAAIQAIGGGYAANEGSGLYPGFTTAGGGANTVQGLDPSVYPRWDNARVTYARAGLYSAGAGTHLFKAFDKLRRRVRFARLPYKPEVSERTTSPAFYAASDDGCTVYEAALRENQQMLLPNYQDPAFPNPQHKGVDIVYIEELDTAEIYPTGSADGTTLSTEFDTSGTTNAGPRYMAINGYYLLKAIHALRYFYKKRPFSPSNQPWNHIMPVDIWHNTVCRSRQRQGIIYPSADITAP